MRIVTHVLGAGCLLTLATPAMAELRFCNETDVNASIAIGYLAGDKWTSEGWWTAQPGQCVTTVDAPQPQAFYYWHAVNEVGEFASEAYFFCAVDDVFTIIGDEDCEARGHNRLGFNEVQIGADGAREVRLTADLAPKPVALRKTVEPEPEAEVAAAPEPKPAEPEPEPKPQTAAQPVPQPSFTLTKDVAVADLLSSTPLDFPGIKSALKGEWMREGGSQTTVVAANRFEDFEDGTVTAAGDWRLAATCPGHGGQGPAIVIRYDENPGESLCMVLEQIGDTGFTMFDPASEQRVTYTR